MGRSRRTHEPYQLTASRIVTAVKTNQRDDTMKRNGKKHVNGAPPKEVGDRVLAAGTKVSCYCGHDWCGECQSKIGRITAVKTETRTVRYVRHGRTITKTKKMNLCEVHGKWHVESLLMLLPTPAEIAQRCRSLGHIAPVCDCGGRCRECQAMESYR